MGIFSSILEKLRNPLGGKKNEPSIQQTQYQPPAGQQRSAPPPVQAPQPIDMEAVMAGYAKGKGGGGN